MIEERHSFNAALDRVMQTYGMLTGLTPVQAHAARERLATPLIIMKHEDDYRMAVELLRYPLGPNFARKRYCGKEGRMAKHSDHGIELDEKAQEQPKDKDRALAATKTEPGHMPSQKTRKENKLPPSEKKGG